MDNATPCTPAAAYRTGTTRSDGWTPERQALFLQTLSISGLVSEACREAGMSETSAYLFRQRADGQYFALGWQAAVLLARVRLEAVMLESSIGGVETQTVREGGVTRRRAFNKPLAMAMLNRLDRLATTPDNEEMAVARAIGSAFGEFIEMIAAGCTKRDMHAFLLRHPDPLAAHTSSPTPPRAETRNAAQTAKLVETSADFSDEAGGYTDVFISARNQRRLGRAKKRRLGAR